MTRKGGARFPASLGRVEPAARPPAGDLIRPQRLLREAAREAARTAAPSGLGLDSAAVRRRMVDRLRDQGLAPPVVLEAFERVPRHLFVDTALVGQAYEDTSLPIGWGQTISKPSVVARMLGLLMQGATASAAGSLGRVLEIGTGCGYQVALLALLSPKVVSIERLRPLHDKARRHLHAEGCRNALLIHGDGRVGHPPRAPYDSIISAAGGDDLPPAWLEQLADGGRLVAPLLDRERGTQALLVVDRQGTELVRRVHEGVHFVPLKSGVE